MIIYLAPLIILALFFQIQYSNIINESNKLHLISVSENNARLLDLYLRERVVNMINIIDDNKLLNKPNQEVIEQLYHKLKKFSDSFVDLGLFDSLGVQIYYAGPLKQLHLRNYSEENWYKKLRYGIERTVITDLYPGLRKDPHFTIAAKNSFEPNPLIIKSALEPKLINNFISSIEKSNDVVISIVNKKGEYQLIPSSINKSMNKIEFHPPVDKLKGIVSDNGKYYAYTWLSISDWAVIVENKSNGYTGSMAFNINLIIVFVFIILLTIWIIIFRSKKIVELEYDKDITHKQLEHASKLATIGELASGIAHEIGNPLNVIANEVGIMQDFINPKFNVSKNIAELQPHFDKIMNSVRRCRDINKKLLSFVRHNEFQMYDCNLHIVINDFISGFFEDEMKKSNIEIIKDYSLDFPQIKTDVNQFCQVLINLLNNAADAITSPGKITISTHYNADWVYVSVTDTGSGISKEHIDKIFNPFFTTKPVDKGTGLGLSVSDGIIKNLGGTIEVESIKGKGSTFTIVLPRK